MDKALNYLSLARKAGKAELGEEPAGAGIFLDLGIDRPGMSDGKRIKEPDSPAAELGRSRLHRIRFDPEFKFQILRCKIGLPVNKTDLPDNIPAFPVETEY